MTLDAGGKGTFLRHESSTVQSAARCNVDHPDIAPSPHLCDAVPAFLRIWMPKDSFPPASSVMWPSPLHDLEELDERLASHRSEGDVLKIAVILRRLLLDHPRGDPRTLIDAVNEGRNVNVQFLVDGTAQPSVQTSVFFMEADGLVPSIGPAIALNMKTFLTHPIIMFQGQTCSVKDVILFAAHVEGAVHKGAPENARQHLSSCSVSGPISCSISGPIGLPFH